jgi:hypothetical protein
MFEYIFYFFGSVCGVGVLLASYYYYLFTIRKRNVFLGFEETDGCIRLFLNIPKDFKLTCIDLLSTSHEELICENEFFDFLDPFEAINNVNQTNHIGSGRYLLAEFTPKDKSDWRHHVHQHINKWCYKVETCFLFWTQIDYMSLNFLFKK